MRVCPISCAFLLFSFIDDKDKLLHIKIEDSPEANISPFLRHLCHFLGKERSLTRKQLACAQGPEGLWHLSPCLFLMVTASTEEKNGRAQHKPSQGWPSPGTSSALRSPRQCGQPHIYLGGRGAK